MISKKTQRVINFLFSIDVQDMRFTDLSEVFESLEKSRACHQLSQITIAAR